MIINNWFFIGGIVCLMYAFFHFLGEAVLFGRFKKFQYFFAPLAGYALYAFLLFFLFHLTTNRIIITGFTVCLATGSLWLFARRKSFPPTIYFLSLLLAGGFAVYAAYVLSPRFSAGHILVARPVFDHMKTAITASIVQHGLPVINPFAAFPFKLHYYFLFFVPCAAFKILFGISAYEAEIVSTMISALLSIGTLLGVVSTLKQHIPTRKELLICGLLAMTAAYHAPLRLLTKLHGFDSFAETLFWTPHTLLATLCLVLVLVLIHQSGLKHRWLLALGLAVTLGLSAYIAIVAAVSLGLFMVWDIYQSPCKKETTKQWLGVISLSALLAAPFLLNQAGISKSGFPISFAIFPWTYLKNPVLQVIGFFTLYCFLQMPALFIINAFYMRPPYFKKQAVFVLPILVSMLIVCFFKTNIANNDLGWRASFVTVFLLTAWAVFWLGRAKKRTIKIGLLVFVLACIRFPFSPLDLRCRTWNTPRELSQDSIRAIQTHVTPNDYFLNNTFDYILQVPADGNLEFMIGSERKSCFASSPAIHAYADHRLYPLLALSDIIFQEQVTAEDILVAKKIRCSKFIFHYTDSNFDKEEMLQKAGLEKIYQNEQIKIYQLSSFM